MSHRWIARDGYIECYACGIVSEVVADRDAHEDASSWPCKPGGYTHPPYIMGALTNGTPVVETCAAHPYECAGPDMPPPRDGCTNEIAQRIMAPSWGERGPQTEAEYDN